MSELLAVWVIVRFYKKLQGGYESQLSLSLQQTDGNITKQAFNMRTMADLTAEIFLTIEQWLFATDVQGLWAILYIQLLSKTLQSIQAANSNTNNVTK